MMIIFILTAISQVIASDQKCDGVLVDGVMHTKEVLKRNLDSPYQFCVDYNSNTLFFSYSTHNKDQRFQSAYLNLQTNKFNIISTVTDGFASAIDSYNNRIFIGAKGGIYYFNLKTQETNLLQSINQNIWQMFYKDDLFCTTYPTEEAYLFKDGIFKRLDELSGTKAMLIAAGQNGNIYFSNSSGLFEYKRSKNAILHRGDHVINGMNADINGKIYFSSPDAIFVIDEKQDTVKRLVTLENVYSAAVEKDGSILYGTEDSIIRLKRNIKCSV